MDKTSEDEEETELHDEWKQVALVIDRLMFWSFLAITIIFTVVVLILIPAVQYASEEVEGL